jgi:hypothetical protein
LQQLKNQNIYDQYKDSLQFLSEEFDKLIFYKIDRVDLSTGIRETFGITSNSFFMDDENSQRQFKVSPRDILKKYLYEIYVILGHPKTLIKDSVIKQNRYVGNAIKEYYYNSHKWDHPKSSQQGTVYSLDNQRKSLTPDQIEGGNIGLTASYTASPSINSQKSNVNFFIRRLDLNRIQLKWQFETTKYEYFIIIKEVNKNREFLGSFDSTSYVDLIRSTDMGSIRYYMIPIFENYSPDRVVISNSITIDPEEFSVYNS